MNEIQDISYIAGIFDGEGYVGIIPQHNSYYLRATITNTDLELLYFIQKHFKFGNVKPQGIGSSVNKQVWHLQFTNQRAYKFLLAILPFVRVKKEQVKLAIEFQEHINNEGKSYKLTEDQLNKRKEYMQKLSLLKQKTDMLEEIFFMQRRLGKILKSSFETKYKTQEERVSALMTALIHEACEVQRECKFKWWKKQQVFDKEKAKKELIDAWHFLVAGSLYLGLTPHDVLEGYREKHVINVQRQETGY